MIHPILAEYIETILNEYTIDIKAIHVSLSYLHIHIFINTCTYYIYYWPPIGRQRSVHFGHFVFHQVGAINLCLYWSRVFSSGENYTETPLLAVVFNHLFFHQILLRGGGGLGGFGESHSMIDATKLPAIFSTWGATSNAFWVGQGMVRRCDAPKGGALSALTDFDLYRTTRWRPKKQIKVLFYLVYRFFWEVKKKQ